MAIKKIFIFGLWGFWKIRNYLEYQNLEIVKFFFFKNSILINVYFFSFIGFFACYYLLEIIFLYLW